MTVDQELWLKRFPNKKTFAIAVIVAFTITTTAFFADHLVLKESMATLLGNLAHADLSGRDLEVPTSFFTTLGMPN